jgi:hypothetical protein
VSAVDHPIQEFCHKVEKPRRIGLIARSGSGAYHSLMTKADILEELRKLPADERQEIRLELAELDGDGWLDGDDPLTVEEKALLEARLVDIEQHPERSIPWAEARARRLSNF